MDDLVGYKEGINQIIWSNEREVRKVVQNYLKNIMDQCDSRHIDKVTNASKSLEATVISAMLDNVSSH